MANRVFEDRVGLWIVDADRGVARLPAIKAFGGGLVKDIFLPRTATPAHFAAVRAAGLFAHLWVAVDGRDAPTMATDTLADITRLGPGALELNIELGADAPLKAFVAAVVGQVRSKRKNLRMRANVGAWKAFSLVGLPFATDPNLYAAEQCYAGDMSPYSQADAYHDMIGYGVPDARAQVCYGAAGPVPPTMARTCTLPDLGRRRRGVIFHDDLMVDAGLL